MIYTSLFQMADPLTALIHAVQVMNFLKTLILKTVKEREESAAAARTSTSNSGSSSDRDGPHKLVNLNNPFICSSHENVERPMISGATLDHFLLRVEEALHHDAQPVLENPRSVALVLSMTKAITNFLLRRMILAAKIAVMQISSVMTVLKACLTDLNLGKE
jgi:hypothetical protein